MKAAERSTKTKWSIDQAHSEIGFKVRHLMIAHVKGAFKTFDASIYTSGKDFTTAVIDLWIDPASVTTGDAKRDEHLKSADFFDVKKHRQITFTASTMGKALPGVSHDLWGELTIAGITKNIKLSVQFGGIQKDPMGNEKAGFSISGVIKRSDWGLVWNTRMEAGGIMIGDEITISCEIELTNTDQNELEMALDPQVREKNSA
ncbi:MAG: YceI family protein [Bacteroidia bacterium]